MSHYGSGSDGGGGFGVDLSVDRSDMLGWLADYPRQLRALYPAGRRAAERLTARLGRYGLPRGCGEIGSCLVLGTGGGSAAAAYVAASLVRPRLSVPFVVAQGYDPPAFAVAVGAAVGAAETATAAAPSFSVTAVGPARARPLVLAVSHSGDTEETVSSFLQLERSLGAAPAGRPLAAAPAGRPLAAGPAGAPLAAAPGETPGGTSPVAVVIAGGGKLAAAAERLALPLVQLPTGMQARAAFPAILAAILGVLDGLGLTGRLTFERELEEAACLAADLTALWGPKPKRERAEEHPLELARRVHDRLLLVYGGAGATDGVARRWKNQLAECGKTLAHWYSIPEAHHDEVVGWDAPAPVRERLFACLLRDGAAETPRMARRMEATRRLLEERVLGPDRVVEVAARGRSELARTISLCLFGDYLACYVALQRGIDPTPVPVIVELKEEMARARG